jgi:tetratricopeptide (TPR) repeat protein
MLFKLTVQMYKCLKYWNGAGESSRVIGIGYGYQSQAVDAYDSYLEALSFFNTAHNKNGTAKVYNNIGNLYRDNEYRSALKYFKEALKIATNLNDASLLASINLNIGNVYLRQQQYTDALSQFDISSKMFASVKDTANLISCMQNSGVAYYNLRQYDKAKEMLIKANQGAKKFDNMSTTIAYIDLTLADIFIAEKNYVEAEKYIEEGTLNSPNKRVDYDYKFTRYQLEYKRKNYEKALLYLTHIYQQDSSDYKNYVSTQIELLQKKHEKDQEKATYIARRQGDLATYQARRQGDLYKFWGSTVVACLSLVVIGLLVANVKRKADTNKRLTELNAEVSRQKDNLDRINHHLEEIIDERTKDLQIKNKKLSEYSSYLSHQIRGPIATLKGLMNLEKEGLVDKKECITMMNKCVSEIDDKIINMSDMLHDPDRAGF